MQFLVRKIIYKLYVVFATLMKHSRSCKELGLTSPAGKTWRTSTCNWYFVQGDIDQIPVFRYSFHLRGLWCPSKRIISYFGVARLILCVCSKVFYAFLFTSLEWLFCDKYNTLRLRKTFFHNLLFFQKINETGERGIISNLAILLIQEYCHFQHEKNLHPETKMIFFFFFEALFSFCQN